MKRSISEIRPVNDSAHAYLDAIENAFIHSHVGFTTEVLNNLVKFIENQKIEFRSEFKLNLHKRWLRERSDTVASIYKVCFDATYHIEDDIR